MTTTSPATDPATGTVAPPSHAADARWSGVGRSSSAQPADAARAASQALEGRAPVLVLFFCSPVDDLPALLAPVRALLPPGAVLAGCTTNGHFALPGADEQPVDSGVVVMAFGGDGLEAAACVVREVASRRREAGAEAAAAVAGLSLPNRACLLLADGLAGDQHEIVRGSYSVLGVAVPTVGGCAGDDIRYTRTHQFLGSRDDVEVVSNGLVSVGIGSTGRIGVGIDHGWSKFGQPFLVTNSAGGRIYELDNRPALDVYLECLGLDRRQAADAEAFRQAAFSHPLGLSRRTGEDIRVVHAADVSDGSLLCLADVPQGAIAWQMSTDADDLVDAARRSRDQAVAGLDGQPPVGLLVFDCGARKVMLGADGVPRELAALRPENATIPVAGFYTYGEIARTHGSRGMHHLTLVTLALS